MKRIVFFIIAVFIFQKILYSQWAPVGACWHYNFSAFAVEGYYKINCIGDTLINNINCRVLEKKMYRWTALWGFDTLVVGREYTYSDQNKVYIYRFNTFYTLYDFSANIGDTIIIAGTNKYSTSGCDSIGAIRIDSTGTMNINGEILRYISVSPTPTSKWGWYARIVEKIGPIYRYQNNLDYNYLFPIKLDYCGMQLDELSEGGYLRCYSEPNGFIYKQLGSAPDCDYIIGISEKDELKKEFIIYPNPATTQTTITFTQLTKESRLQIYNMLGQMVYEEKLPKSSNQTIINTSGFNSGLYKVVLGECSASLMVNGY